MQTPCIRLQFRIAPCAQFWTFSPCQEGNPPLPGNSTAKVTPIIYWQSARTAREHVRLFFACAHAGVREWACVCLLEEPLNGGGGALRTSALLQPPSSTIGKRPLRRRSPAHSSAQERNPHTLWILFLDFNAWLKKLSSTTLG